MKLDVSEPINCFVEEPRVDWRDGRPFAVARLSESYARIMEEMALANEKAVTALPVADGWQDIAYKNPTTARYSSYSTFLLSPVSLPLFFAIHKTYRHLLQALDQEPAPRFIQCWYNIHRCGQALIRHMHNYPFIGTFSAHAEDSETRYGRTKETGDSDVIIKHSTGRVIVTTGELHYHETSVWLDSKRARVTYAFDIVNQDQWNPDQIFLPFDS